MAADAESDDSKPSRKGKKPKPTDWTKTFWALLIPVVTALITATGAVIVGFINAPKSQDSGPRTVTTNILTYLRVGTYLGAKSLLEATATPAIINSQQGDRIGQLANHLSFMQGSDWSAGASGTNRLITFTIVLKATSTSASVNGAVTFVMKRGDRTACTVVLNTQTANKDGQSAWVRSVCTDEVPAGLDPRYTTDIHNTNVSMSEAYAESINATKF